MTYSRDELTDILKQNICEITFTKVNGEQRVMPCTLKADVIPTVSVDNLTENKERKINLDNLSVWCTDKNEWRSFKVANVTEVKQIG
jgi:hypothetical protein